VCIPVPKRSIVVTLGIPPPARVRVARLTVADATEIGRFMVSLDIGPAPTVVELLGFVVVVPVRVDRVWLPLTFPRWPGSLDDTAHTYQKEQDGNSLQ